MAVCKSTDAGSSWTRYSLTSQSGGTYTLVIHPTNSNIIFAGGYIYDGNDLGKLFKSDDGGAHWSDVSTGLSESYNYVYSLAFDPTSPDIMYAGCANGIYKSTNGGLNWTRLNTSLTYVRAISIDSKLPVTIYAGSINNGVYVSTDGGNTWSAMNNGLTNNRILCLTLDSVNQLLFAGTDGGSVFRQSLGSSQNYSISGNLGYYSNQKPIAAATIILKGTAFFSINSDNNGGFAFGSVPAGNYTLSSKKEGGLGSSITAYDASLVLQYAVGKISLTPYQMIAADVSGNGQITAYDASYILRYCVGSISEFPVGKAWKFIPRAFSITDLNWTTAPESLSYQPLNSNQVGQDFTGIIYGDVSGNWSPFQIIAKNAGMAQIRLGEVMLTDKGHLKVPIIIDSNNDLFSLMLSIKYDSGILKFLNLSPTGAESVFQFTSHVVNNDIRVAIASAIPLQNSGPIAELHFEICAPRLSKEQIQITVDNVQLNDGAVLATVDQGECEVTSNLLHQFSLLQNYPNPFNMATKIEYQIPQPAHVELKIFNFLGQEIKTLIDQEKEAGHFRINWDGTDNSGKYVNSGVYIMMLQTDRFSQSRKLILLR